MRRYSKVVSAMNSYYPPRDSGRRNGGRRNGRNGGSGGAGSRAV